MNERDVNILKRIIAAVLAAASILTLSGCRRIPKPPNGMTSYDFAEMDLDYIQLRPPKPGDKIAIIDTVYGEIRVVLYEEYAPKTVQNFIKNAEAGNYNDMPVMGVRADVCFLSGSRIDKKGNYIGRDSDDELIDNEYSVQLWPFAGALMGISEQEGKSDGRWFIVGSDEETLTPEAINELIDGAKTLEDETARNNMIAMFETFYEVGGVFGLAGDYPVYGQTYLGMDVVLALTNAPADDKGIALDSVRVNSVTISEFKEGDETDTYPRPKIHSKDELYRASEESSEE